MFKVNYSLNKDIDNYLNVIWRLKYLKHGRENLSEDQINSFPRQFIQNLRGTNDRKEATKIVSDYLNYQHPFIFDYIKTGVGKYLQIALNEKESEIITKLEDIYKVKFPFTDIGVYITTLKICSYDFENKWFMVSIYGDKNSRINTVLHELNHFMFYQYYSNLKDELGKEKFESLKEALTVFTNPDEGGYPNQFKMREWFKRQKISVPDIIKSGDWKQYL